mmetsp:Transcript_946/g.3981  ORF Transcript_946/g.3981 Transcript_946/m.3981 type:complete len:333 (-) Transcript_946:344-1342(-)
MIRGALLSSIIHSSLAYEAVRDALERDGVAVVKNFASAQLCDRLRSRMEHLLNEWEPDEHRSVFRTDGDQHVSDRYFFESAEKISFFLEPDAVNTDGSLRANITKNRAVNKVGHALHVIDPAFRAYATSAPVVELVRAIGYEDPVLPQSMYIFKQPHVGGAVTSHQDATFLYTTPRQTVLGLWLALEDATLENGCLWARRGSHRESVRRHFCRRDQVADDEIPEMHFIDLAAEVDAEVDAKGPKAEPWEFEGQMPEDLRAAGFEALPVQKGDLVVIHGQVDHLSLPNHSAKSRHTFQLHLIEGPNAGVKWHEGNWLQYSGKRAFPSMTQPQS